MSYNDIVAKLLELSVDALGIAEDEIDETSSLESLGIDSLDVIEIVMSAEDEFKTELPDEDIKNFKTLGDFAKYIEGKLSK